jgi:hypothetical protein
MFLLFLCTQLLCYFMSLVNAIDALLYGGDDLQDEAFTIVLAVVQTGDLHVDFRCGIYRKTLLHVAAARGSVFTMRRLLELGAMPSVKDAEGRVPMHCAVTSWRNSTGQCDALEKCKLLPVADLSNYTSGQTPLWLLAHHLLVRGSTDSTAPHMVLKLVQLLQWIVDQPECELNKVDDGGRTSADVLNFYIGMAPYALVVRTAMAQRARWSTLRAAWTGAVAGAALFNESER